MLTTILLIVHSLLAVTLLGAVTHQALSLWWPVRAPAGQRGFVANVRAVRAAVYSKAVVVLYIATAALGSIIYPAYRIGVRTVLEQLHFLKPLGMFEAKEHLVALGLGLLPAYWYYWRQPLVEGQATTRKTVTLVLTLFVWWAFLVGHILNNIKGFGL